MNMTPNVLGVFANIYGSNDAMDFQKAALVAVVGFCTVLVILAVIALFIKLIAFIFDSLASKKKTVIPDTAAKAPATATASSAVPGYSTGSVDLENVDEPTAAVIMAIVSHQSGISLDRLAFKSIKLMEDK